jgi:hypothetical protein
MNKSNQTRGASVGMYYLYTMIAIVVVLFLTSCGSAKSCHSKGVYVSKSVKKAQAKPHAH